MLPEIHIGKFTVSLYYLAMFLGYVLMIVLMLLKPRRRIYGLGPGRSVLFATFVLIAGVLGCKLLYILENLSEVRENGISLGGFSFFGAVMLVPLLMPLLGKAAGMDVPSSLDSSAICILAMLGTIRIGCFMNGCCGGRIFFFRNFDFSFPTQLMESACDFLILALLLKNEKNGGMKGRLYPRFLLLYGTVRFLIEFLRHTDKHLLGLSNAQWFSVVSILIGSAFELFSYFKRKKCFLQNHPEVI